MMKKSFGVIALFSIAAVTSLNCSGPRRDNTTEVESLASSSELLCSSHSPTHYKFYLENSGSMKGFFRGTSDAKVIITQMTDRLDENFKEGDTISYNFISNKIQPYTRSFDNFLNDTYSKCNAQFSELDKNLEMVMDNVDENSVGLLISDYCFESKDGNWATAQSGITRLFTRRLNQNPDLTVAILKYNAGFNGRYYPGAINCNKSLPLYIWAFGTSQNIKKIVNLKVENEGVLVFQSSKQLQSKVIKVSGKPARGRVIRDGAIIVKEWDKEHYDDIYSLDLEMNVDCLALSKELIENVNTYKISSRYEFDKIELTDNACKIKVCTNRPAPGSITIEHPYQMPQWVEVSNFEGSGLPDDGTTLGFKYLVKGVFDAYNDKYENYFSTSITLK